MELTTVYSKTAKGLRARTALIGGLPAQLMKALSHVDGESKAQDILAKFNNITEQELVSVLFKLEKDGYIRTVANEDADSWMPTQFAPMVVEEFNSLEEATADAQVAAQQAAEEKLMLAQEAQMHADIKAREKAEKRQAKVKQYEKTKAETKVKAQIEAEAARIEAARKAAEAERLAKKAAQEAEELARKTKEAAQKAEEAEREAQRIENEAKEREQARLIAEQKAEQEAAELAAEQAKLAKQQAEEQAAQEAAAEAEAARIASEQEALQKEALQQEALQKEQEAEQLRLKIEAENKKAAEIAAEFEAKIAAKKAEQLARAKEKEEKAQAATKLKAQIEAARKENEIEEAQIKVAAVLKAEQEAEIEAQKVAEQLEKEFEAAQIKKQKDTEKAEAEKAAADNARAEAAQAAQIAQLKVFAEAEENAKKLEKENIAVEMERIAQEAQQERDRFAAIASPITVPKPISEPLSWEEIEAAEEAAFNEEEEIFAKSKTQDYDEYEDELIENQTEHQTEEKLSWEDVKRLAEEEAETKALVKSKRVSMQPNYGKWLRLVGKTLSKALLMYVPVLLLLLVIVLNFVNLSMLTKPIEQIATQSLGQPVTIKEVRASLWPQPHFSLKNVTIGNTNIAIIEAIPETATLFEPVKTLKSIEIDGVNIPQKSFDEPQQWINSLGVTHKVNVTKISFKNVVLQMNEFALEPLSGQVYMTLTHTLKNIELNNLNQSMKLQLTPQTNGYDVALTGNKWALPINQKLVFNELSANGNYANGRLEFSQIAGDLYGGKMTGNMVLDMNNQFAVTGNIDLINANSAQMTGSLESDASVEGKFNLSAKFNSSASQAVDLNNKLSMNARFDMQNGKINGIDLKRAVVSRIGQSLAGSATSFDKLTGNLQLTNGHYQFSQLALNSKQFYANGNMDVAPNQQISGKISANLTAQTRRLFTKFNLAGNLDNPKRQ